MIYNIFILFVIGYLLYRDHAVRKVLANDFFVELAKGNKRYFRGWWKVNPNDYEKIALDNRTHEQIAKEYNVSRSRIGAIKKDYYSKRESEGREIVQTYFQTTSPEIVAHDDRRLFDLDNRV